MKILNRIKDMIRDNFDSPIPINDILKHDECVADLERYIETDLKDATWQIIISGNTNGMKLRVKCLDDWQFKGVIDDAKHYAQHNGVGNINDKSS